MEAGLEHLTRSGGTLAYADVLLIVMEPTRKSVVTAARTLELANDLGIPRVYGVGNKIEPHDEDLLRQACRAHGITLAGLVPRDEAVRAIDRAGEAVTAEVPPAVDEALAGVMDVIQTSPGQPQR